MPDINKTDLVARLRRGPANYTSAGGAIYDGPDILHSEAADAIEALVRERDEARTQVSLASDPAYLATVIDKVGMVDAEWKVRAESAAAEISRLRDALKPFAGDKLPGNNRDHIEYDRYGLRRIMSDMEIARRNAFFALYPEEHPLAKEAARTALEANHG